jgi:alpha-D-ribose 1-methylphosphonate 5-triphosphate synthase subunit PhnH
MALTYKVYNDWGRQFNKLKTMEHLWAVDEIRFDVGSDAAGDLFYRGADNLLHRVGIGTDGQILTAASGLPTWADATATGDFIENQFAAAQTANFWITGHARIDTILQIGDLSDESVPSFTEGLNMGGQRSSTDGSGNIKLKLYDAGSGAAGWGFSGANFETYGFAWTNFVWYNGTTERVRINDSGELLVNIADQGAYKLQVGGASYFSDWMLIASVNAGAIFHAHHSNRGLIFTAAAQATLELHSHNGDGQAEFLLTSGPQFENSRPRWSVLKQSDNPSSFIIGYYVPGPTYYSRLNIIPGGATIFNIGNQDFDFHVAGSANYLIWADASASQVGINTNTLGATLTIGGDLKVNTIVNAATDTDKFLVDHGGVIKFRTGAELISDLGIVVYTDEQAQDAVGNAFTNTNTIQAVYTDLTPSFSWNIIYQDSLTINLSDNASGLKADIIMGGTDNTINDLIVWSGTEFKTRTVASLGIGTYTDENAQDAVNAMLASTATIAFTYTDATPELKFDLIVGAVDNTETSFMMWTGTTIEQRTLASLSIPTQYTDEMAQDAVGNVFTNTNTIQAVYSDTTPSYSWNLLYQDSLTINLSDDASGLKADVIMGGTDNTINNLVVWDGDEFKLRTVASLGIPTQYTDEMAQDAINAMLISTATVAFTYTDLTPELRFDLVVGAVDNTETSFMMWTGTAIEQRTFASLNIPTQYTDEMAQDAINAMLVSTATVAFTYTDVTPELKFDLVVGAVDNTETSFMMWNGTSIEQRTYASLGIPSQYTDEMAQDAVGGVFASTNTVQAVYADATPSYSWNVLYQDSLTINLSDDASGLKADVIMGGTDNTITNLVVWDGDEFKLRTVASLGIGTYTNEDAQDAVNAMLISTATIAFTYTDATPELKFDLIVGAVDNTETSFMMWNGTSIEQRTFASLGIPTQYTDEMAQDAVNTMLVSTATIAFTYTDLTPELKFDLVVGAVDNTELNFMMWTGSAIEQRTFASLNIPTQYTDEMAQDAIGNAFINSNTIQSVYDDVTPDYSWNVIHQDTATINLSDDASGLKADIVMGAVDNTETSFVMWDGDSFEQRSLASLNIPAITPAALTRVDDTNVTLTLGGTPGTALLQATSLTLGWTGVLAMSRGGLGVALTDPGANRLLFWNDSTNEFAFLTLGTNLSITGTTLNASGTGGTTINNDANNRITTAMGTGELNAEANFTFDGTNVIIHSGYAAWSQPSPGTTIGGLHLATGTGSNHLGNAITFGAHDTGSGLTAQAGIYARTDGGYGTNLFFATTDNYTTGAQIRMGITETGWLVGGLSTTSVLRIAPTRGNAAAGAKIMLNAGNHGATTGLTIFDNGHVSAGYGTAPTNFSTLSFSVNTHMAIVSNAAGNTPSLQLDYDRTALGGGEERVTWGLRIDTDGKLAYNQARSSLGGNIDRFWITEDGVFTLGGNGTYGFGGFEATAANAYIHIGGAAHFNSGKQQNNFWVDGTSDYLIFGYAFANRVGILTNDPQATLDVRGSAIFNHGGLDVDFLIKSDTHADAFHVDGTDGAITIGGYGGGAITGTATRQLAVDVNGKIIEIALGGGGIADADYGDITVSGSGAVWTIDNNVVTFAKMQDIATDRFLGRNTAASGDIEELTPAVATSMLDIFTDLLQGLVPASGGGTTAFLRADGTWIAPPATTTIVGITGTKAQFNTALTDGDFLFVGDIVGVTDGDKGDITVSSTGTVWTIDNSAVTYAKIQNVSAGSRILGRFSGSAGVIEELTAANVRTVLGFTTVGEALTVLTNPSAVTFIRINADNTVSTRTAAELKTDLSLNNVENTALSTWAGSTNITTLGTITTGVWNGTDIAFANIQDIATARILGRVTAATGVIEELTGTQATTLLDVFTSGLKGLAPASGGGTTAFLRADGTWAVPAVASVALSAITAATAGNSIDNVGHAQVWQWSDLGDGIGLTLYSDGTDPGFEGEQRVLGVYSLGANESTNKLTQAAEIFNTRTGSGFNIALTVGAQGGTTNTALYIVEGNVRIGSAGSGSATHPTLLFEGKTSGIVTVKVADAAGTWTFTLPVNDGDANQFMMTNGSGTSSWKFPNILPYRVVSANNYNIVDGDGVLDVDNDANNWTIVLPDPATCTGKYYTIKRLDDTSTGTLTVDSAAGNVQDPQNGTYGATCGIPGWQQGYCGAGAGATWQSNGTNWVLISTIGSTTAC